MRGLCSRIYLLTAAICFGIIIVLFTLPARAQTTYGSIAGIVTDPSGAPIAGAQVTLTNLGTAEKRSQATGNDGLYLFPNLFPPVQHRRREGGIQALYTRPEVIVEVNQTAHIDASMQVGDVNQAVEVTAETPLHSDRNFFARPGCGDARSQRASFERPQHLQPDDDYSFRGPARKHARAR